MGPEALVAMDLLKDPGLTVRDRPGAPSSITAKDMVEWLQARRSLSLENAVAYADRMVKQDVLIAVNPAKTKGPKAFDFSDKQALYKLRPPATNLQR